MFRRIGALAVASVMLSAGTAEAKTAAKWCANCTWQGYCTLVTLPGYNGCQAGPPCTVSGGLCGFTRRNDALPDGTRWSTPNAAVSGSGSRLYQRGCGGQIVSRAYSTDVAASIRQHLSSILV
jgi:hypothetical protein